MFPPGNVFVLVALSILDLDYASRLVPYVEFVDDEAILRLPLSINGMEVIVCEY